LIGGVTEASLQGEPGSEYFYYDPMLSRTNGAVSQGGSDGSGLTGLTGLSATGSGNGLTGSLVSGTDTASGQEAPSGEEMGVIPSFGINTALVFGSTVTVSSIVRRREGQREFDRLISFLLRGIFIFTAVNLMWLISVIL
jgi:Ca2+/Na+ antiporter